MTGWIGIALGDFSGIGPEVALKALAAEAATDDTRYLLIGDAAHLRRLNEQLQLRLTLEPYSRAAEGGRFFVHSPSSEPLPETLSPGSAAALAALSWLTDGTQRCLRRELDALVTAPVNKASIIRAGEPFIGQTEFLSELRSEERRVGKECTVL